MKYSDYLKQTGQNNFSNLSSKSPAEEGGILPSVLGIGGSLLGGALGGLGGTVAEPGGGTVLGAVGGSALGGAAGQGLGQAIQDITSGSGFDLGRTGRQSIVGGLFGAIPGGEELKALPVVGKLAGNLAGRTALRAGTGYLAGNLAQQVANKGNTTPQNQYTTGLMTGAINAIAPGLSSALNILPKGASALGKITSESANRILERQSMPDINAIQRLFGKSAISTSGGKAFIAPEIQNVIDKYNLPIPPSGNISDFISGVNRAADTVESELQPILNNAQVTVPYDNVKQVIMDNASVLGSRKKIPADVSRGLGNVSENGTLSQIKNLQRIVGSWANWENPTQPIDKFAIKAYGELGKLIDSKLNSPELQGYKDLMQEHQILAKARDAYQGLTKGKGTLPEDVVSKELAQAKLGGALSGERARELGLRFIPVLAGGATQFTGLPKEVKDAALIGTGLYGAAEFGPYVAPERALQIGQKLQNLPQAGAGIEKLLQQIGVRIPGLGQ